MSAQPSPWQNRMVGTADVAPDQLLAHELNFRRHPKVQQAAISGSLREIGWIQNCIVSKRTGKVIDGHARVGQALREGAPTVPVVYVDLSEDEERLALAVIDPISAMAYQDDEQLAHLLASFDDDKLSAKALLEAVGHDLKVRPGAGDPEAVPKPPKNPTSRLGDLWLLGYHRLAVGDCATPGMLERLMLPGESVDLFLSDPPYNVAYVGAAGSIQNDSMGDAAFLDFLTQRFAAVAAVSKPGAAFYVFHAETPDFAFAAALEAAGFERHQTLVWAKTSATLSRGDYNWRHEPIYYGWKHGAAHYFAFDFTETTVIDQADDLSKMKRKDLEAFTADILRKQATTSVVYEDKPSRSIEHPTMKPVALLTRLVGNSSRRGEIVLDPFGGSGSTLIACEQAERVCRTVEIDPVFADVIVSRWQEFTGGQAVHADTAHTFGEVKAERARK